MAGQDDRQAKAGQRVALLIAGVGLFWICANAIGGYFGLSNRVRALFDLAALAGFGFALWQTYLMWRRRHDDQG